MGSKFKGDLETLKEKCAAAGLHGEWTEQSDVKRFKTHAGGILNWWPTTGTLQFQGPPEARQGLEQAIATAIEGGSAGVPNAVIQGAKQQSVFVVHGHDHAARDQLELVLHKLGLKPFVLMNTSGAGMTIIEALESQIGKSSVAQFAIVLVTPDDIGYAKKDGPTEAKPRARQNVILEMGMLLSSLTRRRVAILVKGFVEQPGDAQGIIYLNFNEHVKETVPKLAQHLQAAGINISAEQVAHASA